MSLRRFLAWTTRRPQETRWLKPPPSAPSCAPGSRSARSQREPACASPTSTSGSRSWRSTRTQPRVIQTAGLGSAHLYALCRVHDAPTQRRLASQAAANGWSVRELERAIQRQRHGLPGAPRHWTGAHPDAVALAGQLEDAIAHGGDVAISVCVLRGNRFEFRLRRRLGTRSTGDRGTPRRRAVRRREPVARAREEHAHNEGWGGG